MGLKKNNPGCGCCDPGPCLNPDTTLYTGLEISGAQILTASLAGTSFTGIDPNGVFLWSAKTGGCSFSYPSSWRLGSSLTDGTCCNITWQTQLVERKLVETINFPGFDMYLFVLYNHIVQHFLYITNTSTRWRMENRLIVAFSNAFDAALLTGGRITTIGYDPNGCTGKTATYTSGGTEVEVIHDDTRTNTGIMSLPYTSSPSTSATQSRTATWETCSASNSSNLSSNRDSRDIDWGFDT
jgi:hypothetical protein